MSRVLNQSEIQKYLKALQDGWDAVDDKKIRREFHLGNFKEAMIFVKKVANLAESEGHHPDIHIFYNKVMIELWTHSVGGLSEKDFKLAIKIDNLCQDKIEKGRKFRTL